MESMFYLCSRQFSQTLNSQAMHGTITYPLNGNKRSAMNALFNDVQLLGIDNFRQCAEWDTLSCSEQMSLEDLIGTK